MSKKLLAVGTHYSMFEILGGYLGLRLLLTTLSKTTSHFLPAALANYCIPLLRIHLGSYTVLKTLKLLPKTMNFLDLFTVLEEFLTSTFQFAGLLNFPLCC